MNRTDRLYAVREELRRAGPQGRTAEQLAATFEVSVRTVKRDISALQAGGFPVWARLGRGGGYAVDAAATLPPVNFTPAEVSGLAVALTSVRGQPFAAQARTALGKVLSVAAPADRERAERLAGRVWVDLAEEQPAVDPQVRRLSRRHCLPGACCTCTTETPTGWSRTAVSTRRSWPALAGTGTSSRTATTARRSAGSVSTGSPPRVSPDNPPRTDLSRTSVRRHRPPAPSGSTGLDDRADLDDLVLSSDATDSPRRACAAAARETAASDRPGGRSERSTGHARAGC